VNYILRLMSDGAARRILLPFYPASLRKRTKGLGTNLFVKVPRPGDSEGTFLVFDSSQVYL